MTAYTAKKHVCVSVLRALICLTISYSYYNIAFCVLLCLSFLDIFPVGLLPFCLTVSLLSCASCSREPPTTIGRQCMTLLHTHTHTRIHTYHIVYSWLQIQKYHFVSVYIHQVQKALEIRTAVPCIIHGHSRRKELVSRANLLLSISPSLHSTPPLLLFSFPSLYHAVCCCCAYVLNNNCLSGSLVGQKLWWRKCMRAGEMDR